AGLLEEGEGRIDHAGARRIDARGLLLDGLDQIVAVARLLLDEIERDQAQIARGDHPADAEAVAEAAPIAEAGPAGAAPARASAEAAAHGLHLAPGAVLIAMHPVVGAAEIILMMCHIVSPIYLTIVGRYAGAGRIQDRSYDIS